MPPEWTHGRAWRRDSLTDGSRLDPRHERVFGARHDGETSRREPRWAGVPNGAVICKADVPVGIKPVASTQERARILLLLRVRTERRLGACRT